MISGPTRWKWFRLEDVRFLVLVPILFLLIAIFAQGGYQFYTLLRIVVFFWSICATIAHWRSGDKAYAGLAATVAILFNPFHPVYLRDTSAWHVLDGLTIPALAVSARRLGKLPHDE